MNKNELLKYAAFGLMGIYLFNQYKNSGFGDHYLKTKDKINSLLDKGINGVPIDEKNKKILNYALKQASNEIIDNHFGVRGIRNVN